LVDYGNSFWLLKHYESFQQMNYEVKRLADSKYVLAIEYRTFEKSVLGQLGKNGKAVAMLKNQNLRWDEKTLPVRSLMFREDSFKHPSRNQPQQIYIWRESDSQCLNPF
jgi:hypothetical protein